MKNIICFYKKAFKIFKRYWQKIAVLSLVSKVIVLAGLFSVIPVEAQNMPNVQPEINTTQLPEVKLDINKQNPIQIVRNQPEIKVGSSKFQEEEEAKARQVLARATPGRVEGYQIGPVNYGDLGELYLAAEKEYGVPALLIRAVASTESGEGGNMKTSSAGAMGFGQFMPGTWRHYGGNGNPYDPKDAIPAMARLLASNGGADNTNAGVRQALLAYNHSNSYVNQVLNLAAQFGYTVPE